MNRKSIVKSVFGLFAALCAALAFVVADVGALTQNTNSSTTEQNTNSMTTQVENTNTVRRGRRGRRGRRRARPAADADAAGAMTENTNTSDAMPAQDTGMAGTQNTGGGTQEDLSGTYTGRVRMTGGHEMAGQATLTITGTPTEGQSFTLESEGMTHSGRVFAVNTRRYVGAAFYFTDLTDPATNTPLACSVRVRRTGRSFSLMPVTGARNTLRFNGRSSG